MALEDVVLPEEQKQAVMDAVLHFERFKEVRREVGMDAKLAYGLGMALLFHGESGTGKTMLANAMAAALGKRILLINFPTLGTNESGAVIRLIFREAKVRRPAPGRRASPPAGTGNAFLSGSQRPQTAGLETAAVVQCQPMVFSVEKARTAGVTTRSSGEEERGPPPLTARRARL